jgi:ParB family chromosome partitioning protein
LQLESEIRRSLVSGEITEGHARALLGLPEGHGRMKAWREVMARSLTVRETEALVRRSLAEPDRATSAAPSSATRADPVISDIESRLRRRLSTRVTVTRARKGAKIAIECFSSEEFDSVVQQLLGDEA